VCRGEGGIGLAAISISPKVPVVAVGGPVKVYYDEVGARLGAQILYPAFCEVANAVGAATGVIAREITIHVSGTGGVFRVLGPEGNILCATGAEALTKAGELARNLARAEVLAMGSEEPELKMSVEKDLLPDAVNDDGIFAARVTVEAIGRPHMGKA
jgi:N-methylhydantoinase A/oxoprolinase/acetone carboxylase beta subunit